MCTPGDTFLAILAIFFPPIAVWIKSGICTADSIINILLCVLGYIPGLLHAWYVISLYPEPEYEYQTVPDAENARVTYYYVDHRPSAEALRLSGEHAPPPPPQADAQRQYGTLPTDSTHVQAGSNTGDGSVPPTYEQAIKGDHKVQS